MLTSSLVLVKIKFDSFFTGLLYFFINLRLFILLIFLLMNRCIDIHYLIFQIISQCLFLLLLLLLSISILMIIYPISNWFTICVSILYLLLWLFSLNLWVYRNNRVCKATQILKIYFLLFLFVLNILHFREDLIWNHILNLVDHLIASLLLTKFESLLHS